MPFAHCMLHAQGANVTDNVVAGLVVDSSADVTIINSNFSGNSRQQYGGSALLARGTSALLVQKTEFARNRHAKDLSYGGNDAPQTTG